MKKIILLPLALTAVFLCGCERNSNADKAQLDALAQKIDVVLKNQSLIRSTQTALFKQMEFIETQVVMLPTAQQIVAARGEALDAIRKSVATPVASVEDILNAENQKEAARRVFLINVKVDGIQESLRNLQYDLDSRIKYDLDRIKMKMGIF